MNFEIKQYWDLSDQDAGRIYHYAAREGLLAKAFPDNVPSREMFELFIRRAECFCAVYVDNRLGGFFRLSHFEGDTARLHLSLPASAPAKERVQAARLIIDWCFATFEFKSILTVMPAADPDASGLWPGLGAARLADIPGLCPLPEKRRTAAGAVFMLRPPLLRRH